jgi:hypothetical protein
VIRRFTNEIPVLSALEIIHLSEPWFVGIYADYNRRNSIASIARMDFILVLLSDVMFI